MVFGLAGAVVAESVLHVTTPALFPLPTDPGTLANTLALKIIFYGFAALGALAPDIDNARSTIGQRSGFVSKGIQHIAGHRTFFHSLFGLVVVGLFIWAAQYAIGLFLFNTLGLDAGEQLASGIGPGGEFPFRGRGRLRRISDRLFSASGCRQPDSGRSPLALAQPDPLRLSSRAKLALQVGCSRGARRRGHARGAGHRRGLSWAGSSSNAEK